MSTDVPLPEPDVYWDDGLNSRGEMTRGSAYSRDRLRAYGDARAAAEREKHLTLLRRTVVTLAGVCVHAPELGVYDIYSEVSSALQETKP